MGPGGTTSQQPQAGRPRARLLLAIGSGLLALAWALTYLSFPFGRDQGIFAWVGEVVLRGGLPYRDAWDLKGPATHLLFALSHWLFGRTQWGIRLLDLASLTATMGLIWHITRQVGCRSFRWLPPMAFFLWYAGLGYWDTAQPDGWATALLATAIALALPRSTEPALPSRLVAGFAVGTAALFKPFYASFLLLLIAAETGPGQGPLRKRTYATVAILSGALVPVAATLSWFTATGGLEALVDVQWYYNRLIHREAVSPGLRGAVNGLFAFFTTRQVALAAALLGISALGWRWRRREVLIVGWLALALAWVLLQSKFYIYHWIPFFPPLAILAAYGLETLRNGGDPSGRAGLHRSRWPSRCATILALAILGFAGKEPLEQVGRWSARVIGLRSWAGYYQGFGHYPGGDYSYWASLQVARYLRANSEPDDTVFIWGIETIIYYLAEREPPTRFIFNHPFTVGPKQVTSKYRRQLIEDLHAQIPDWVILVDNDLQKIQPRSSMEHFREFPELRALVEANHCQETVIEDFTLLRRCREPAPTAATVRQP